MSYKPRMKVTFQLLLVLLEHSNHVIKPREACEMRRNVEGLMQSLPVEAIINLRSSSLPTREGAQLSEQVNYSPVSGANCHPTALGLGKCCFF